MQNMIKETRKQLETIARYVIAIGESGKPSSDLWMTVIPNEPVEKHMGLLAALQAVGWVTVKMHYVELTAKGLVKRQELITILTQELSLN